MFSLLSRRPRSRSVSLSFRPMLESLEARTVPSTVTLNVEHGEGKHLIISGQYNDPPTMWSNPPIADQTILLTGVVCGSATTDDDGNFSVNLVATGLGDVNATAENETSNTATVTVTDVAPLLTNFSIEECPGHMFVLSGDVCYAYPTDGLIVNFAGAPISINGKTAYVTEDGHFEVAVTLTGTTADEGVATASLVSPWGTASNTLNDYVHQTGV